MLDVDAVGTRLEAREESRQRSSRKKEIGGRDGQQGEPQHDGNEFHRWSFRMLRSDVAIVAVKSETQIPCGTFRHRGRGGSRVFVLANWRKSFGTRSFGTPP